MNTKTSTHSLLFLALLMLGLVSCSQEAEEAQTEAAAGLPNETSEVTEEVSGVAEETVAEETVEETAAVEPAAAAPLDFSNEEYLLFVSNEDSNNISVVSGTRHEVLATIHVGKRPRGMKASPDGSHVYVALTGSPKCPPTMSDEDCEAQETDRSADGIAEVDVINQEVTRILESGENPEQFDVNWDLGRLYVSNEDISMASILDLESGELLMQSPTGREPEGVRLSPDGSMVFVTGEVDSDVTILDAESGEQLGRVEVGMRPRDVVFTADGATAYIGGEFGHVVSILDVASQTVTAEIRMQDTDLPMELELSPDESTLYVSTGRGGTVAKIDLGSNTVTDTVAVGERPWGLAISPDGEYLFTANGPSDDVSVIEVASFSVVDTIAVGETPWGVKVAPAP